MRFKEHLHVEVLAVKKPVSRHGLIPSLASAPYACLGGLGQARGKSQEPVIPALISQRDTLEFFLDVTGHGCNAQRRVLHPNDG